MRAKHIIPKYIYRYRSLDDEEKIGQELGQELCAIRDSYLWFSNFCNLNDPAELANPTVRKTSSFERGALKAILPEGDEIANVMDNRAKWFAAGLINKDTWGVCCFSETEKHQAMWAYYASNFSGMCVRYDVRKLLSLNDFCWGDKLAPIQYDTERVIRAEDTLDFGEKYGLNIASSHIKHPDWSHEKEWRLLLRDRTGKSFHTPNAIREIILGSKVSVNVEEKIKKLADSRCIIVSKVRFDNHILEIDKGIKPSRPKTLCGISDEANKCCLDIIAKGYDEISLLKAVKLARSYPNAKTVFLVNLSNEDRRNVYIYITFELADGSEKIKSIRFQVYDKKVMPEFEYNT